MGDAALEVERRADRRDRAQPACPQRGHAQRDVPAEREAERVAIRIARHVGMLERRREIVDQPDVIEVLAATVGAAQVEAEGGHPGGAGRRRRRRAVGPLGAATHAVQDDDHAPRSRRVRDAPGDAHHADHGIADFRAPRLALRRRRWPQPPGEQYIARHQPIAHLRPDRPRVPADVGPESHTASVISTLGGPRPHRPAVLK